MSAIIDYDKCTRCGTCIERCPEDVLAANMDKSPLVKYPYECWYCGACYIDCPAQAVTLEAPVFMQFVAKPYEFAHKRQIKREY